MGDPNVTPLTIALETRTTEDHGMRHCYICDRHLPESAFWRGKRLCKECQWAMHVQPTTLRDLDVLTNPPPKIPGKCVIGTCISAAVIDGLCVTHDYQYRRSLEAQDLCPECAWAVESKVDPRWNWSGGPLTISVVSMLLARTAWLKRCSRKYGNRPEDLVVTPRRLVAPGELARGKCVECYLAAELTTTSAAWWCRGVTARSA